MDDKKVKHIAIALRESIDHLYAIMEEGHRFGNANVYIDDSEYRNTTHTRSSRPRNWDREP